METTCEICNQVVTELRSTDLGEMCLTCSALHRTCDHCGDLFHFDHLSGYQDYLYCEDCYEDLISCCEDCGDEFRREHSNSEGYCYDCRCESDSIHQWDYQPHYKFYGKGPLYFGIELEIEFNNRDPEFLLSAADHPYFFLKHDGSISDGAEVVSHPASFKWINDNFQNTWEKVLKVREKGMRSFKTATCGIHIHMSKRAFSQFHLYKFLRFVRENSAFLVEVSQRNKSNLDQWSSLDSDENIIYQTKHKQTDGRYVAVNLQPPNTMEIRIFRGNLSEEGFRKNLEFCKALFDFTTVSSCSNLTAIHFHKFVMKNKKQFPNLLAFLATLKITKMKRKPTANGVRREFPSELQDKGNWIVDTENDSKEWVREDSTVPAADSVGSETRRMEAVRVEAIPQIEEQSNAPDRARPERTVNPEQVEIQEQPTYTIPHPPRLFELFNSRIEHLGDEW